ncbi:MAG TPA: class II fumarate hydratase [Bryobacteraceae bacterium]|jgi:fumarate hydratase class II|nr:class II fumarate hydratase [Bryobacteraceae bacterium]
MTTRTERDTMGEMAVPADALYGAQTARAVENFPISSLRLQRPFIRAMGIIKAAAARVNGRRGWLDPDKAAAIEKAALQVASGDYDGQFVVDVFQTGSGTSTNMNANEVIGHVAGAHPNDDVNRGQSSNDVFPSAMHIAAAESVATRLLPAMEELAGELLKKSGEFHDVIKIGRTHLQDAVPMRLGQEFSGYAEQVAKSAARVREAVQGLYELPLGGTAVGTGLNAPEGFAAETIGEIGRVTGLPFVEAANHFEAQAAKDAGVFLSGALRGYAVALTKIANDIRWLGSGPRCGIGELKLQAVQPGSSIMPGKVNPVIAESVAMVCAQVIGYDATIAWCAAAGNFELNVMMPVMAYDLLESIELLAACSVNFSRRLVAGLEADRERAASFVERSLAMGTALVPDIGYERAAALVKEAHATGRTVREVAGEKSGLSAERLRELLDPGTQAGSWK